MNRIKEVRRNKGLTQEQLASAMGVSRQTIVSYELGVFIPRYDTYKKLATILETSVEHLAGE